ncbi:two-component system, chemotaxis family, response regulator CheY [Tranquillimonas rosea]|uniref:Two-component system, chemotaxis family, response regulator CheY n=1 Tax=Tranquillimonas rosea TaxID=641238 RepID=A0A1H9VTC2_9RHOB|nr:response regulator [Tranquillimonas rosea]SES24781.1 two-component system, chemotaxis family, response regulator CheY [Tranquillimonas rosea]
MGLRESLSIMVVDDMSTSRGIIIMALEEIGVKKIDFRKDGAEALQHLVASPVHLVISDYNMPGMDGLALLKGLREHRMTQRIGFILVSGRMDQELLDRGRALGMNNCIAKPFTTAQLKGCIEAVTGPL